MLSWKIGDRMDLTLECIRRFYVNGDSPLGGHYSALHRLLRAL